MPYIIEYKGSLDSFNTPGETQKRRMQEILEVMDGLNIALLQVKFKQSKYRMFYNEQMDYFFKGTKAPIEPIVEWIKQRIA